MQVVHILLGIYAWNLLQNRLHNVNKQLENTISVPLFRSKITRSFVNFWAHWHAISY